jgi:hypothetical protein
MEKWLVIFLFLNLNSYGKKSTPNYSFSLKTIDIFYPGVNLEVIKKKYPKTKLFKKEGGLYKTYIEHSQYKFPVFFKVKNKVVTSFFARLPTFFLHDLFHQSLIDRYGKQDRYKKVNKSALYFWDNEKGIKLTYKGECTITCFPSYLAGQSTKASADEDKSILQELSVF